MRLVVVSNRVTQATEGKPLAGGLAVGIDAALKEAGGIWFGWSGATVDEPAPTPRLVEQGSITYALADLTEAELAGYYAGFANRTLWPLFHYRLDLAAFEREWWTTYRRVNERFATQLATLLAPDDIVWIHDYHLIPMASELRRQGVQARLGFFLHIPFPAAQLLLALPWHRQLVTDLCAYDTVGFQTAVDLQQFEDYLVRELRGEQPEPGRYRALGRSFRAIACPIGVDIGEMEELARSAEALGHAERMRQALRHHRLLMGVDRLDYSKGIPERLRAFDLLLRDHPEHHRQIVLLQISAPSREDVPEYVHLRTEVEQLAGSIIGRYAEPDWIPLRYINRTYPRRALAGLFRLSSVGFLTPLRDGLNLIAEEFVAAQDPLDPAALVLSRFAGVASVLEQAGALIVNPHDVHDTAAALNRALIMSPEERADRHKSLLAAVRRNDINAWRERFLGVLRDAERV